MEFLSKRDGFNNEYNIKANKNNNYLKSFLIEKELFVDELNNEIIFKANNVNSLEDYIKDKFLEIRLIDDFIYDLGYQILRLKNSNLGILKFNLSDILIINNHIFLINNPNIVSELYQNRIKLSSNSFIIGNDNFLSPELKKIDKYPIDIYYSSIFYSLAEIILFVFNIKLEEIYYTKVYFFLERCLLENPLNRIFLFI
jgi:hypothetical protein